ncbi:protein CHLOROPLAST ENHANCING STRESS TOLERANCE, chloroplastic-like [Lolium rigidum]|uniref:protein CHLOROPLAST ENHANCING STRESS TOLERANCE, chloroplastic-like n=1 Tax=Lolium rigidum TaxID=89674 RepID=UPI001F5D6043|nr:protein CHLOROPLAST ENHANCING STRESS TOLERANCE, chloroplastic-like [Lolium rigidum]
MALLSPPCHPPLLAPARHRLASHHLLAVPETPTSLLSLPHYHHSLLLPSAANAWTPRRHRRRGVAASIGKEDPGFTDTSITSVEEGATVPPISFDAEAGAVAVSDEPADASPEDLESIAEIKRVLDLLQKNRDMTFGEVKLTIMIEDPRDVERKRLLGIEDPDELTRDDLADALVEVNEGRIPENRDALMLLAKEMSEWPDVDIKIETKKSKGLFGRSSYAKATDTGIDPVAAAKRLNIDFDSAADIDEEGDDDNEEEIPSAVGYGALYLVSAFPVIIGVSVVLILFYNSLQ